MYCQFPLSVMSARRAVETKFCAAARTGTSTAQNAVSTAVNTNATRFMFSPCLKLGRPVTAPVFDHLTVVSEIALLQRQAHPHEAEAPVRRLTAPGASHNRAT